MTFDAIDVDRKKQKRKSLRVLLRLEPFNGVSTVLVLFFVLVTAYALFRLVSVVFWQKHHFNFSAFSAFANTPGIVKTIGSTAFVVACAAIVSVVIGGAIAWLNERTDVRMGAITDVLPFLPFLTPAIAGAIGWVVLLSPTSGLMNAVIRHALGFIGIHLHTGPFNIYTYPGLIFVYSIYMVPYAFLMISTGLRSMDSQLEEQARMCGARTFRTLTRVVFPAIAPSVAGAFLLVTWIGFGMYSVAIAIALPGNLPIMTVSIVQFLNADFPPEYSQALILGLIIVSFVGIAWYLQTRILRTTRHATTGGKGRSATRSHMGIWKWPLRALIGAYVSVVTFLPGIALLLITLNGFWAPNLNWKHFNLSAFHSAIFGDATTILAIKNSFIFGGLTATIGIFVAAVVSVLIVRSRNRMGRAIDGTMKASVIFPHLILAIGFVLAFSGPPFHLGGTWIILLLAYLALFMPQGTLVTDPAVAQVGMELAEAARISGAGNWRTFRRIYLPLMLPAMAIGWALIFVRVLGDLEVSAILAGPGNPTIGYQTQILYSDGTYSSVAALDLILIIATTIVVVSVLAIARRRSRWAIAQ